jgi:CubicO group peptidase (beta-lactamase class C family)
MCSSAVSLLTSPSRCSPLEKASLLSSVGEFGWGGWASTFFAVDPLEQLAIISFAQLTPSDRYPIRRQLRSLVYSTLEN